MGSPWGHVPRRGAWHMGIHNPHDKGRVKDTDVAEIWLTCGHKIKTVLTPLHENARYACSQNLGCGYRLLWVRYRIGDATDFTWNLRNKELGLKPEDLS